MSAGNLFIDIETFSDVDIKKCGLHRYAQAANFQILLFAYATGQPGDDVKIVDLAQGEQIPSAVVQMLFAPTIVKHAYNAAFEWTCLNRAGYATTLVQWRCTMAHGLYCGYPAGLDAIGKALQLPAGKRKKSTGTALINTFCVPQKPTARNGQRTRTLPRHEPEKWKLFKEYCMQDVATEIEVERQLQNFPVPESEQYLWQLDQVINSKGIAVDQELVDGALYCDDAVSNELAQEAMLLTGLENPNSVQQLIPWLEERIGEKIPDLTKATVKKLIEKTANPQAKRMLKIRQQTAKTSVKKYQAMKNVTGAGGRARGLFQYYGANRTGRWAGRLIQLHNLPRNSMKALPLARDLVKAKRLDALMMLYPSIPDTLSQLTRTAFIPTPGCVFLVADFSAIEARVIAWLAQEQWRLDVFAGHGKIYEASASAMFGVPIEKITKGSGLRQKGKIAELALGYQGSVGALIKMGALEMGLTEDELPEIVHRWRSANRRIVDLWYSLESAAMEVMRTGAPVAVRNLILAIEYDPQPGLMFFTITLPSGRQLYYPQPFVTKNAFGKDALHYYGVERGKWQVIGTYGGKLAENVTQAIARDCLAEAIKRLMQAGYEIVMHVHDEVVIDTPPQYADSEKVCGIMCAPIEWAPGLVLKADSFVTNYYKKD